MRRRNNEVRKRSASGSSGEGVLTGDGRHKGKRVEGDRAELHIARWRREREEKLEKIRAKDEEERKAGKGVYWDTAGAGTETSEKTLLDEDVRRWELEKAKQRAGSPLGHVKWGGGGSAGGSASEGGPEMREAFRGVETHPAMTHSVRSPTMPSVSEVVRRSDDSGDSWERRWHALGTEDQSQEQNRHSVATRQSHGSVEQGRAAVDERSWLNDRRDWI